MAWESMLMPTSACGVTFRRLSLVAFPSSINCAVSDDQYRCLFSRIWLSPLPVLYRYRPVYTGLNRLYATEWTYSNRQHSAAREKWDWTRAHDVYLSTTISGRPNQFTTLPLLKLKQFTYSFVCRPAPGSQKSALLCSCTVADLSCLRTHFFDET